MTKLTGFMAGVRLRSISQAPTPSTDNPPPVTQGPIVNELGTLKAGKLADIIIVDGNPLEHIRNLADPVMVFKDGIRYK
jgi:hypothetical protein